MKKYKQYLGDSVYADFDGFNIVLTTENGHGSSNTIFLEPEVYESLTLFVEHLKQQLLEEETSVT